ncbi:MAG: DAK2 domain-containing protein [Firmicutes bacterium]|nr:DAK2 domain-containing protein [Bacillota bacterium]
MDILKIDGKLLAKMIISGADELNKNHEYVNELNVFPVPDGDTGTNMSLTVQAAKKEIEDLDSCDIGEVAKSAAMGALKGARGNSGVIMSQLFRGFAKSLEHLSCASKNDLVIACKKASEMAYKAVMKPKEGTILTMSREIALKFEKEIKNGKNLKDAIWETIVFCKGVLDKTREMLPELKQAGVVDSGARGLLFILEGALKALDENISFDFEKEKDEQKNFSVKKNVQVEKIDFDYEVLMDVNNICEDNLNELKEFLLKIGDSLVVTEGDEFTKIHVHTNKPGKVIEKAFEYCDLFNARFENLRTQSENNLEANLGSKKDIGILAVAMGNGLIDLFKNLGADEVIDGGKLMNPCAQDLVGAINKINAKKIIILPNHKNVLMPAKQTMDLCKEKEIIVLPTKTIPQGLNALLNYIPSDLNLDEQENNLEEENNNEQMIKKMCEAISLIKTGQITYAARDTEVNNIKIKRGDYIGTLESDVVVCNKDLDAATKDLIDLLLKDGGKILSLYYGEEINLEKAKGILDYVKEKYEDIEADIYDGGQPLYYYLISVE